MIKYSYIYVLYQTKLPVSDIPIIASSFLGAFASLALESSGKKKIKSRVQKSEGKKSGRYVTMSTF